VPKSHWVFYLNTRATKILSEIHMSHKPALISCKIIKDSNEALYILEIAFPKKTMNLKNILRYCS
jgi:hypothetical protein